MLISKLEKNLNSNIESIVMTQSLTLSEKYCDKSNCSYINQEHYHCYFNGCEQVYKVKVKYFIHLKHHMNVLFSQHFTYYDLNSHCEFNCNFNGKKHFHCKSNDCNYYSFIESKNAFITKYKHYCKQHLKNISMSESQSESTDETNPENSVNNQIITLNGYVNNSGLLHLIQI